MIVGFAGKAGAGKDTAGDAFIGHKYDRLAIARPLKEACRILFNFTEKQLYDPIEKEVVDPVWGKSPREILQWLGTDVLRKEINDDFLLILLKERIKDVWARHANGVIITDVRFPNEAKLIKEMGGIVIKIVREGQSGTKFDHSSEKELTDDLIDVVIENNGTIEEFDAKVKNVCWNYLL